jgi:hypothetical protein
MQIGHNRLSIAELKSAVKLNPVCGRRNTHRIFFYQVGRLLASIVAIRELLKNSTTSITVVRMMEEDCGSRPKAVRIIGMIAPYGPAAIIEMII